VKPGEKPPELDARGTQHTDEGALYFAGYFVQALDWSIATNDATLIRHLGLSSCSTCNTYIAKLDSFQRGKNGHVSGGRISITSERLVHGSSSITADEIAQFTLLQEPDVVYRPSSAPSTDASTLSTEVRRVYVSWIDLSWKVVEMAGNG